MTPQNKDFIIIDDSKLDCFIAEKIIQNTGLSNEINTFMDARQALEFIKGRTSPEEKKTVIIVDIQMPVMNGFEFVEAFESLSDTTKANYTIYVLTSSANLTDINRIGNYASVSNIISKPLSKQKLFELLL